MSNFIASRRDVINQLRGQNFAVIEWSDGFRMRKTTVYTIEDATETFERIERVRGKIINGIEELGGGG